eukprot:Hpha_TRINITY_DN35725_c0_g1::TRINITY_DN35725_c0_g1_i1::g.139861::m.139861
MTGKRGSRATAVTNYEFFSLESSMVYHLIYHYSIPMHINHLIFLNTYMFGVFLAFSSTGLWPVVSAVAVLYALYAVMLTRGVAVPYALFVGGMACGAWFVVENELIGHLLKWHYALVGLGVILVSFILQLAGHAVHEDFKAPPLLKHGFVSAPVLEFMSLVFRLGLCRDLRQRVYEQVETARADAEHQSLIE